MHDNSKKRFGSFGLRLIVAGRDLLVVMDT